MIIGSADMIENELGWAPQIDIYDTIQDMIECMEKEGKKKE